MSPVTRPKFRAWHKELNVMLYPPHVVSGSFVATPHTEVEIEGQMVPIPAYMTWDGRLYMIGKYQDVEWFQSIGLFDYYKREVFEGDILRNIHTNVEYRVQWESYFVQFSLINNIDGVATDIKKDEIEEDTVIIGNIREEVDFRLTNNWE